MKFTILGGSGFIGSALVRHLRAQKHDVETPARDVQSLKGKNLGHVIYAIGLTGNFRERPDDAIEAHVHLLQKLMKNAEFESWLYLSSTRVYSGLAADVPAEEGAVLSIRSGADALYDLSKLLGESICLGQNNTKIRVARLSNVYGAGQSEHTFLGSILRDLKRDGQATIHEAPQSSKDYVSIDDVTQTLELIATRGQERLYNVASGTSVTHQQLADIVNKNGVNIGFETKAPARILPAVHIGKITKEFGIKPRSILENLPSLLK